ncbi:MAG: 1-acyl-sn-glycerol-3-phosphate acyltransferase [Flavobacteriales bacterium]|nr:1-acyl-sn-glycerol-3-phosphate acyltransferase [Flavobacteriales bacterium]
MHGKFAIGSTGHLLANHQNAMLDPLMVCLASKNQLHWLTRADIFRKPSMNWLLRKINMLPVYRERDRVADLAKKTQETFDECYAGMKPNSVICIFPEGTHRGKKQLVPLKKRRRPFGNGSNRCRDRHTNCSCRSGL